MNQPGICRGLPFCKMKPASLLAAMLGLVPTAAAFHFSGSMPAVRGRGLALEGALAASRRREGAAAPLVVMSGRRARPAPRQAPGGSTAKRAGRLGKLVMTELTGILRSPYLLKVGGDVDAELAACISVVEVDMSGDNKVAKVMVSAMGSDAQKKRAVQWLNKNARAIRFSLAQRISHLKTVPELRFSASALPEAMEVMTLLDQLRSEREARESAAAASQDGGGLSAEEEGEQELLRGLQQVEGMMQVEDDSLFATRMPLSK